MNCTEKGSFKMPSLTLWPNGLDRSKISPHYPGWCFLVITPKQLTWRFGIGEIRKGPATRPFSSSESRYWSITDGWGDAEGILWTADCQDTAEGVKTKTKTTRETCDHMIHFDLIGVKTKFTPQFLSLNGGNPRRKEQILLRGTGNQAHTGKGVGAGSPWDRSRESLGPATCWRNMWERHNNINRNRKQTIWRWKWTA